jgi:hypothetical protein
MSNETTDKCTNIYLQQLITHFQKYNLKQFLSFTFLRVTAANSSYKINFFDTHPQFEDEHKELQCYKKLMPF